MIKEKKKSKKQQLRDWIENYLIWGPGTHGVVISENSLLPLEESLCVLDVETDEKDNFVGGAIYFGKGIVYYYSDLKTFKNLPWNRLRFIFQGGVFDFDMLKKWGIVISEKQWIYDTKILSYVYDSTLGNYSLKQGKRKNKEYYPSLVERYLPKSKYPTYKEIVGGGKTKVTLDQQSKDLVMNYCSMDAIVTYKLMEFITTKLSPSQLEFCNNIEFPIYRLLGLIMKKGIYIDVPYLEELNNKLTKERDALEASLQTLLKCNIKSSKKELLPALNKLGFNLKSTDSFELNKIKNSELIKDLLEFRRLQKLVSTYTTPLLKQQKQGLVYPSYAQNTDTGRLSSYNPNNQNNPMTKEIRRMFISPPGYDMIGADYSQVELRLFAYLTKDPNLIEPFKQGLDLHRAMAAKVFKCDYDKVTDDQRKIGKTCNFGIVYGATEWGLVRNLGLELSSAKIIFNTFWEQLPIAKAWIQKQVYLAKEFGSITTLYGRKREFFWPQGACQCTRSWRRCSHCNEIQHKERQVISTLVQGGASDILKVAMLKCYNAGYLPRATVHDELLFYSKENETERNKEAIKKLMEFKLGEIDFLVDVKSGKNWSEVH